MSSGDPRSDQLSAVPRETRAAAAAIFGDRAGLAVRFAHHLTTSGVDRGLLGPGEIPRVWERHLLNCGALAPLLPDGARVIDVGSGAGLPGVVLGIARPDISVTLVEPLLRRVSWLRDMVGDLGLRNVAVTRARAQEVAGRVEADVVTSRAVAPLLALLPWCLPLVAPGGSVMAIKGASAASELARCEGLLRSWGAERWSVETCGEGLLDHPTTLVVVVLPRSKRGAAGGGRRAEPPPRA